MEIGKISIIGGLILSALGIIGNVVIAVLNKKFEFENQIYKTIIDCAYKEWETKTHLVKDIAEKTGRGVGFVPFSDYILFYLGFVKLMRKKTIKEIDVDRFFKEYERRIQIIRKYDKKIQ